MPGTVTGTKAAETYRVPVTEQVGGLAQKSLCTLRFLWVPGSPGQSAEAGPEMVNTASNAKLRPTARRRILEPSNRAPARHSAPRPPTSIRARYHRRFGGQNVAACHR